MLPQNFLSIIQKQLSHVGQRRTPVSKNSPVKKRAVPTAGLRMRRFGLRCSPFHQRYEYLKLSRHSMGCGSVVPEVLPGKSITNMGKVPGADVCPVNLQARRRRHHAGTWFNHENGPSKDYGEAHMKICQRAPSNSDFGSAMVWYIFMRNMKPYLYKLDISQCKSLADTYVEAHNTKEKSHLSSRQTSWVIKNRISRRVAEGYSNKRSGSGQDQAKEP